jgi:hypothetical protein
MWKSSKVEATGYTPRGCIPINAVFTMMLCWLCIQDYAVGWACALLIKLAAATAMLDEKHQSLPYDDNDPYLCTLSCIGKHNVVLTCLPIVVG